MADLCLVPQVFNAKRFGVDMANFPLISRINGHLESMDAFKAAHPDVMPDAPAKKWPKWAWMSGNTEGNGSKEEVMEGRRSDGGKEWE